MIWNYKSKLTIYLDITNMEKIKIQVLFYIQKNLDELGLLPMGNSTMAMRYIYLFSRYWKSIFLPIFNAC